MPFPGVETFDSYANGDSLDTKSGGSGWDGNWSAAGVVVSNEQAQSGTLSAKFDGSEVATRLVTVSDNDEIDVYFYPSASSTNCLGVVQMNTSGSSTRLQVRFNYLGAGQLRVYDGASWQNVGTINPAGWNLLKIVPNASGDLFSVYLNGSLVANAYSMTNSGAIGQLYLEASCSGGEVFYFDTIQASPGIQTKVVSGRKPSGSPGLSIY